MGQDSTVPAPARAKHAPATSTWRSMGIALLLFVLALLVRTFQIGQPSEVVFDEVHFGKYAAFYITGRYFFDVHPPLAKLMVALGAWLAGFDGRFEFNTIGESYIDTNVPYRQMRAFPALIGSLYVPLVYMILRETGISMLISSVCALAVLADNAHILQSRLILLDAPMVLFILCSLYTYIKFYTQRYKPFSASWWCWLFATGISLALTISCKMVGVLTFATIGGAVLFDLWDLLDIRRGLSMRRFMKHFCARAFALIILPFFVYLGWFYVHFALLTKSGPGDDFMSTRFQQTLVGNDLLQNAMELHYLDTITLQHRATEAYLHSHDHHYPLKYDDGRISSEGQQVTAYEHPDSNNLWKIMPVRPINNEDGSFNRTLRRIYHGNMIRLMHVGTNSFLLAHDVASPLMPTNEEITTVPAEHLADELDDTVFELHIDGGVVNQTTWHSRRSRVRLIHNTTRVAVWTRPNGILPSWAFGQLEVNGIKNAMDKTALWVVDDVQPDPSSPMYDTRIRPASKPEDPKPIPFLDKFLELQHLMLEHNSKLVQSHPYASRPWTWPIMLDGVLYWSQDSTRRQLALFGNIVGWWAGLFGVLLFAAVFTLDLLLRRRGQYHIATVVRHRYLRTTGFFVFAWACHYLPFFIMGRQLFLHHYLPAHVCAILVLGGMLEMLTSRGIELPLSRPGPFMSSDRQRPRMHRRFYTTAYVTAGVLVAALVAMYIFLAPFTYGHVGLTAAQLHARRLLPSWRMQYAK